MDSQKFCLKWDGFQGSVTSVFDHLRADSELVDVTLCCEGQRVRAHRMMLSACSPYFRELFKDLSCQQLVIFLKDTSAADLTAIVEFMYKGKVNVSQGQLASFIKTAEMLQVQGLSGGDDKDPPPSPAPPPPPPPEPARAWSQQQPQSPAALRRATDTASPSEPRLKRRRSDLPPPPPIEKKPPTPQPQPQAPQPGPAAAVGTPAAGQVGVQPPPEEETARDQPAGMFEGAVKVEKFDVDLTLDDDEDTTGAGDELEAALGNVAQYEGYDPGSDQSLSADGHMFGAGGSGEGSMGGAAGGPYTPGTSQRAGEDGSQDRPRHICPVCGAGYINRNHMVSHMRQHQGETTCPFCGKEFTLKYNMRRHILTAHKLSHEEVNRLTKTRMSSSSVSSGWMNVTPGVARGSEGERGEFSGVVEEIGGADVGKPGEGGSSGGMGGV
ncbi:myc-associated zinc finger protein-like isoform X4 [Amphibalanus amphitrite]|uniref:myc-associated zinc finger protein-like isoform X4 n=1 Tax=Amphibalanus amphitrite TaxID=1232801 RepID=UPI001C91F5B6|nr:myc-associated zinc finger protein-like isoform X4 [Amphibalanus amphitrite]